MRQGIDLLMIALPDDDTGPECRRALDLVVSLGYRVIVLHMDSRLARLMASLGQKRNMFNGSYTFAKCM